MKIDGYVESLVRNALDAVVKRDFDSLDSAVKSFPDDRSVRLGVELALAVIVFVMVDAHEGWPTDEQTAAAGAQLADMEEWIEATPEEVTTFLTTLMSGGRFAGVVPVENVIILTFVVAGALLSSCRRDDEKWWDYLDRAEAVIEARG